MSTKEELLVTFLPKPVNEGIKNQSVNRAFALKTYKRRWLMLALFILYSTTINSQWVVYSIISNIVIRYYDVSSFAVDCTSMSYMFFYVPFIFPASYLSDKLGVRWSLIIGSSLSCLGAWIKAAAVSPDRFYLALIGQSIVASTQVLMLPMPGRVAAKWFGSRELSTASSVGVFGTQLGVALSFLLPPMIVKNHKNKDDIGTDLFLLSLLIALVATVTLMLILLLFQEEPKLPPSETRALQKVEDDSKTGEGFTSSIKRLLKNKSFILLCNSYGMVLGVLNVLATLLNQMFLVHYKEKEEDAGRIGLLMVTSGMFGSVVFGIILDKTHKFKESAVIIFILMLLGQTLFSISLFNEIMWISYLTSMFYGFFLTGYISMGYELAAEYTYPEAESLSGGILNIANNMYGVGLVILFSFLFEVYGDISVHIGLCLLLLFGLIITSLTKNEKRRQDARKAAGKSVRDSTI